MKYYELEFRFSAQPEATCEAEAVADILSALLADTGFESFEPTDEGLKAYVQMQVFDEEAVNEVITNFPLPDWAIAFEKREAAYENWNEQWEREGFQPIIIGDDLCVHDASHNCIPETGEPLPKTRHELIVSPRLAFGSGTHPTTRQLLEVLLEMDLEGQHVIDAGCGTGILGMLCLLRGAAKVSAYDIDEWSVENSKENAALNHLLLNVYLGDASVLPKVTLEHGKTNLLIANINRNILLNDIPVFSEALLPTSSRLLLSGFYEEDIPCLVEKATALGLTEVLRNTKEGWAILMFQKS